MTRRKKKKVDKSWAVGEEWREPRGPATSETLIGRSKEPVVSVNGRNEGSEQVGNQGKEGLDYIIIIYYLPTMAAISTSRLTYFHNPFSPPALVDINLNIPKGSRIILVGANGGLQLPLSLLPGL